MTPSHITVILNPVAGRGKARHIHAALLTALEHSGIDHTFQVTAARGHATELAKAAAASSSIVVAVGGDGTVNEVASGLVGTDAALAVMSEGSGNDFARMVAAPSDPARLIGLLRDPVIASYDVGAVKMLHGDGEISRRHFFNSVGLGFDAAVARKVSSITWMRGIPLYLTALLRTLSGYKPHYFTVRCNGAHWQKFYFLLCVGNGKWEGGGFKLTPNAVPDDGQFEVCGVTGTSILKILPVLPSVMTGTHLGKKNIESFDTAQLFVHDPKGFPVHGDGEIFGWQVIQAEITLLPRALRVVMPHTA
ncbi:MAG: diacylglycerol kinase family lipid kinase [Bacteroidetes bacterium]|nr:diacylglycerol kinase family lipid kinase [Bacteroidota bacterium]